MENEKISFGRKFLELVPLIGAPFYLSRNKNTKLENKFPIIEYD